MADEHSSQATPNRSASEERVAKIPSPYLTQDEAAQFLRMNARTLERLRCTGNGPIFARAGRRIVYRLDWLEAYLDARTFRSTRDPLRPMSDPD